MTESPLEADEADRLEQLTAADDDLADFASDIRNAPAPLEANEADVAEQRLVVPSDEDDREV